MDTTTRTLPGSVSRSSTVPMTEITDNGPKTVERKVFPGYVLVKMIMTDETWHLVRNIRGVTGFGSRCGPHTISVPQPWPP